MIRATKPDSADGQASGRTQKRPAGGAGIVVAQSEDRAAYIDSPLFLTPYMEMTEPTAALIGARQTRLRLPGARAFDIVQGDGTLLVDPLLAGLLITPLFFLFGLFAYRLYYETFERRGSDAGVRGIAFFFGIAFIIEVLIIMQFGVDQRSVTADYVGKAWRLGDMRIPFRLVVAFVVVAASAVLLVRRPLPDYSGQVTLINDLLAMPKPVIAVGLREPYEFAAIPGVTAYLAAYNYRNCGFAAAADAIFGVVNPSGLLPVTIPGLYSFGHGLSY